MTRIAVLALWAISLGAIAQDAPILGKVTGISDRNSLFVQDHQGTTHQVVLAFLTIPYGDQPYAERASEVLEAQLKGRQISIRQLPNADVQFVRGIVYIGRNNFNMDFLKRGHAWLDYHQQMPSAWHRAQLEAQAKRIGIYEDKTAVHPYQWRKDQEGAKAAVSLLDDIGGSVQLRDIMNEAFVGNRKTKIYVDLSCNHVWREWASQFAVPHFTRAGAEDSGYTFMDCPDT